MFSKTVIEYDNEFDNNKKNAKQVIIQNTALNSITTAVDKLLGIFVTMNTTTITFPGRY